MRQHYTTQQWALAAFCLLLPLAFWPELRSGALAPRWGLAAAALPLILVFSRQMTLGLGHFAALLLWGWAAATLPHNTDGAQALIFLTICGFAVAAGEFLTERALAAFAWGMAASVPFVVAQWWGYVPFEEAAGPAGLFTNKNIWAEACVLALIFAIYTHRWLLLAVLGTGFYLSHSRGALLALAAAVIVWLWARSRFWAIAAALVAIPMAMALATRMRLSASAERFAIWQDTALGLTLWGHGLGSFFQLYPVVQQYTDALAGRADHAHNEYLETAFELGLPGLALVALALALALWGKQEQERLLVAGCCASALVGFPFHMPVTAVVLALCCGRLWASRPVVCWDLAVRRTPRAYGWSGR